MPTNLRIMAVKYMDDGRWFGELWYGDRQIEGVAITGQNGCQPWDVILDSPDSPVWAPFIARLKGVHEDQIDWSLHRNLLRPSH